MKDIIERMKGRTILYDLVVRVNKEGNKVFVFQGKEYTRLNAEKLAESDEILVLRRTNFSAEVREQGKGEEDHCRSCGAVIVWNPHPKTGKNHPYNLDGTSHFSNCPNAAEWRGKKRQAEGGNR